MSLGEAILFVLYHMQGRATSQYVINTRLFFYYMWLSDVVDIHPLKFVPSMYGPICTRLNKTLITLEENECISTRYSDIMYSDEFDASIDEDIFGDHKSFLLMNKGDTYARDIKVSDKHRLYCVNQYLGDDVLTLWETVKLTHPEQIRSMYGYKANSKGSKHKDSNRPHRK